MKIRNDGAWKLVPRRPIQTNEERNTAWYLCLLRRYSCAPALCIVPWMSDHCIQYTRLHDRTSNAGRVERFIKSLAPHRMSQTRRSQQQKAVKAQDHIGGIAIGLAKKISRC
nr:hypothetical protein CFP56_58220 [Quercus suber]